MISRIGVIEVSNGTKRNQNAAVVVPLRTTPTAGGIFWGMKKRELFLGRNSNSYADFVRQSADSSASIKRR
jgi:hypothetical protein